MKRKIVNCKLKIVNCRKGFTLIELLLFMGIFSILILALFQLLVSIFDVQLESQSSSVVVQDGRYILNKLTYDINNSKTVITPEVGGQGQTLVISDGATTYTYTQNNGNLTLNDSTLGTTNQLNSTNSAVSNLNFLRLSDTDGLANTITVSFTLSSKFIKRSGAISENFKTTLGTR